MKKSILLLIITTWTATASAQTDAVYQWAKGIGLMIKEKELSL